MKWEDYKETNAREMRRLEGTINSEVIQGMWFYHKTAYLKQPQQATKIEWRTDNNGNIDLDLELLISNSRGLVMGYYTEGTKRTSEIQHTTY